MRESLKINKKFAVMSVLFLFFCIMTAIVLEQNTLKLQARASGTYADEYNLQQTIAGIIDWKKSEVGATADEPLFNNEFLRLAGTTAGDWFPIGMGRYGFSDDYDAYSYVITDFVSKKYEDAYKLDKVKATEWHRISLAIAALGGDPTSIGDYNGQPINLIADGTYNRGITASPGRQGINGWIWGLIAMDSNRYEVPQDAFNTRQDFIVEILRAQLEDGGFALIGAKSDADITAMAMQALAPYYNSELEYEYTSSKIKQKDSAVLVTDNSNGAFIKVTKSVKTVIDECLLYLSATQTNDGDFSSWGTQNAESTCQVMVALTALGVDPLNDSRFIKNGNNLFDGIIKYKLDNGGFFHSAVSDPDNPSAVPNQANSMASEQALYALVSLYRQQSGMRTLYDMRSEFTLQEKADINDVIVKINNLTVASPKTDVENVFESYEKIDSLNRCYVTNYWVLSQHLKRVEISLPTEDPDYGDNNNGGEEVLTYFTQSDAEAFFALPPIAMLTTQHYVQVIKLYEKLKNAENKQEYIVTFIALEKAKNGINDIQAEIDSINARITSELHPFDNIGLGDRKTIGSLVKRYGALSEYDKTKITHYEDLLKSKTQVDNLFTALIVSVCGAAVAVGIVAVVICNIRRRKIKRARTTMPQSEE